MLRTYHIHFDCYFHTCCNRWPVFVIAAPQAQFPWSPKGVWCSGAFPARSIEGAGWGPTSPRAPWLDWAMINEMGVPIVGSCAFPPLTWRVWLYVKFGENMEPLLRRKWSKKYCPHINATLNSYPECCLANTACPGWGRPGFFLQGIRFDNKTTSKKSLKVTLLQRVTLPQRQK